MRIGLQSTLVRRYIGGREMEVWQGETEGGIACFALVTAVVPAWPADAEAFATEQALTGHAAADPQLDNAIPPGTGRPPLRQDDA